MPASVTPIASTTVITPSGMSSIAARVDLGDDQDSGVARSSRAGTKRSVKASPTRRFFCGERGIGPFIQVRRTPFFNSTVVSVPVEICSREALTPASSIHISRSKRTGRV